MLPLRQGSIVWTSVADQYGNPPKRRPVLIVSSDDDISELAQVVGIVCSHTSALKNPQPDCWVWLPFNANGNGCSKLTKPTVAICTWPTVVPSYGYPYRDSRGWLPLRNVAEVMRMVNQIKTGCNAKIGCGHQLCQPNTSFSASPG